MSSVQTSTRSPRQSPSPADAFGQYLASLRSKKTMSQADLDQAILRGRGYVRRWECTPIAVNRRTLLEVARVLQLTPAQRSRLFSLADARLELSDPAGRGAD